MLIDFDREGKSIPAVVQATKTGMLFVFDRETGEPVFEIVERPVPTSTVPEVKSLHRRNRFPRRRRWSRTLPSPAGCMGTDGDRSRQVPRPHQQHRSEGLFTPPSLQGTILSPSFVGGVNWGSLAFDHERQLILAAVNHVPMVATLVPRDQLKPMRDSANYPDSEFAEQAGTPYAMRREMLASPLGLPCTASPWGSLAAIDLRRNAILWQVVLGSTRDRTPWFVPSRTIGMPNMGGHW